MPDSPGPGRSPRRVSAGRALPAGVLAVVLAVVLGACSGSDDTSAGAGGSASGTPSSSAPAEPGSSGPSASPRRSPSGTTETPAPSASPSASPSGSPGPVQDPTVGPYKPVKRPGRAPHSVSASPQPFGSAVRYGDGLRLVVTDVTQSKSTSTGPGSFPGQPVTRVALRMDNGSKDRLDLDEVVVTGLYGSARRQARPVYDARSRDFSGTVDPGDSATAVYAFSVPTAQLGSVRMIVDFDGVHTVATFTGDPRTAD